MSLDRLDDPTQQKSAIPVEAPPTDESTELVRTLTPELTPDEARTLANRILSDFHGGLQDRLEWERRLVEWEDQYYNRVSPKNFPWPGASNFHVPITMIGVETFKPRLVEAIMGAVPPLVVIPARGADEDRKDLVEQFLNWQILTEIDGLEELVNQSAHLFLQPGIVYAKVYWKVTRTRRRVVREFPVGTPLAAIFETLFGTEVPEEITSTGDLEWEGQIAVPHHVGPGLAVTLKLKVLTDPASIQVLVDREEITEHPQVDLIDPPDIIAPAKGGQRVVDPPWIQHRVWMTEDELRQKVIQGRFGQDAVQALIDSGVPKGDQPSTDSQAYHAAQDQTEGTEGQGPSNVRRTQWAILEDYRRYDIDHDGLDENIITWTCEDIPDRVLGWDYLDNVYAHGRRPIRVGRYFPIPFRWYPLSFAEVVKGIQDEINAIHNQSVDAGTLQNLPWGFKRASSTLPPITQRVRPGEFIDVDNPQQDILIPKFGGDQSWGAAQEAVLMQYFERLTGVTDLSLGRQPNRVGATRTASGTQTLLSEAGLRFKIAMQAFQRFWAGIFSDVLALDQEYLPPQKEFRVTGKLPTVLKVRDRSEIRGRYDLRLASTAESLDRQGMREDSSVVIQAILNPALIQAGIVGIKGVRRGMDDLLKSFGRDPDLYLEPSAPIRSPQEELQLFLGGTYVDPVMGEDYQAHLVAHQTAMQDPVVPPEVRQFLRRHIQATMQIAQATQMAQMLQGGGETAGPPVGPQAVNAQIGRAPQPALGPGAPGQPSPQPSPQGGMPGPGAPR